jgi:tetratricopeptide (TPR) repeat protein
MMRGMQYGWINGTFLRHALILGLATWLCGCVPARAKELNQLGRKAYAERKYEKAIAYFRESLSIYPKQPEARQALDNAKAMLKQIYVYKIYELVDGGKKNVEAYLSAWKMSAALPELKVPKPRVASIRVDLMSRFQKNERRLRKETEAHKYYAHLTGMGKLVPDTRISRVRSDIGLGLMQQHVKSRDTADKGKQDGLALLHATAAATFAPRSTGLWGDVRKRREALLLRLAIDVRIDAQSKKGARHAGFLLGGLRRRTPRIFRVTQNAALAMNLSAAVAKNQEQIVHDKRSARCQVGTRRVLNRACPALKSRAKVLKAEVDRRLAALETARKTCETVKVVAQCTRYLSDAEKELAKVRNQFVRTSKQSGRCPTYLKKPIYKMFFYARHTISRRVSIAGRLTLTRGGKPFRSRGVTASAYAKDTYGDGLGCARIMPDPLQIPSFTELALRADRKLLDRSLADLLSIQRQHAIRQLEGGDSRDERLDALVRARLVDDSYARVRSQLRGQLAGMWFSDFGIGDRLVR